MREPLTLDDLDTLEAPASTSGDGDHGRLAEHYLELARDPHPDDELLPGDFLVLAGEHRHLDGDTEGALRLFAEAATHEVSEGPDPRAWQVRLLFALDRPEEALELSEQLRRSRPTATETYLVMGEVWEGRDGRQALGWLTRGAVLADETQAPPGQLYLLCMARWRVRAALGHQPDEFDEFGIGFADALSSGGQD